MKKKVWFLLFVFVFIFSFSSCEAILEAIFGGGSSGSSYRNVLNETTWMMPSYGGANYLYFGNSNVRFVYLRNEYTGTYSLSGDTVTLTVTFSSGTAVLTGTIIGNSMSITGPSDYSVWTGNYTRIQ